MGGNAEKDYSINAATLEDKDKALAGKSTIQETEESEFALQSDRTYERIPAPASALKSSKPQLTARLSCPC